MSEKLFKIGVSENVILTFSFKIIQICMWPFSNTSIFRNVGEILVIGDL